MTFKKSDLVKDIYQADWLVDKIRQDYIYSQNVYAAMCNNKFLKLDVIDVLAEYYWTSSWRRNGYIISEIANRNESYLDYYCSSYVNNDETIDDDKHLVGEGYVTDEVRQDFLKLGWTIHEQTV
jgi:hypothetical protein